MPPGRMPKDMRKARDPKKTLLRLGDEEFPPGLRFLWDENALMYIRYETMYYAKGLLLQRLAEKL